MNRVVSSLEYPLSFLKRVTMSDGEEYLRFLFENPDENNCWFNQKTGTRDYIKILPWNDSRGNLLDEETNEREFVLSFSEFLKQEFENQIKISKELIYEQSKQNGKDQDAKLYSIVLIDCLEIQKSIDLNPDIFSHRIVNLFIKNILSYVFRKFEKRYPNTPEIRRVNSYFLKRKESNLTGFKLQQEKKNAILHDIISYLRLHNFVTSNTKSVSIFQFFQGEIPTHKIDWGKDLSELKYFIDSICNDKILAKAPKQQWKYLSRIFTCHGEVLPEKWHRNNNKLKRIKKRKAIEALVYMLQPSKQ